jgi:hypothetical protein
VIDDPPGAFCRHTHVALPGAGAGPLAGLTFAVKDVFDLSGNRTGAGNPEWLRTHLPVATTAPAVQRLLDAGARVVGKTHTDELAYSLNGKNGSRNAFVCMPTSACTRMLVVGRQFRDTWCAPHRCPSSHGSGRRHRYHPFDKSLIGRTGDTQAREGSKLTPG